MDGGKWLACLQRESAYVQISYDAQTRASEKSNIKWSTCNTKNQRITKIFVHDTLHQQKDVQVPLQIYMYIYILLNDKSLPFFLINYVLLIQNNKLV